MSAALIGVDWGTSSFRAFLIDGAGAVLERRAGPHGILSVKESDFATVLRREVGAWLAEHSIPIVMSGMIGSRQGWVEAPYVTTPAGVADLAAALVSIPFDGAEVRIVPGVETATPHMRDVIRGEETQIVGALALSGAQSGRFLLPGTHSKWARVEDGRITAFSTYMTGEIYAAARGHTILGRLMQDGDGDPAIFRRGVREGARAGGAGALLNRLFGVRTAGLFGEIAAPALADYLSGILIGAEIADAAGADPGQRVSVGIIAADALAERYRIAMEELSLHSEIVTAECIVKGYVAIARLVGLVSGERVA